MIKYLPGKLEFSWFFIALLGFIIVLPFSHALVSIFGGVIFVIALIEDNWKNKIDRLKESKYLLAFPAIYSMYIVSYLLFYREGSSTYDLQKAMFFLVLPVGFIFGKPLSNKQKRFLFYAFVFSVFVAILLALFNYFTLSQTENFEVHSISIISHIRFSFQLALAAWFLILFISKNKNTTSFNQKLSLIILTAFITGFLFFQQSLTGIFAFVTSVLFFLVYSIIQFQKKYRNLIISFLLLFTIIPIIYVSWVVYSFYDIEEVSFSELEEKTINGNLYEHHLQNKSVENGNYTFLYICHDELRDEWNKISDIKYDDDLPNGFPLYSVLIRYMTSKGLRKDANGFNSMTKQDIKNVENGMANIIYEKKYSLYPRIYQTVWEFYMYSETGDPNYQSFSQRIEFSKAALSIIKRNFWFGVGSGNWKQEFAQTYKSSNSKLRKELYASSHNQYLNYWVKFGFVGLLIILFLLIYPVIKTKSYTDSLFLVFLVFMLFANFADSNFESHMGSSFFVFFFCLFIIRPRKSYLYLKNK